MALLDKLAQGSYLGGMSETTHPSESMSEACAVPKLLVSVRDVGEALFVRDAGVDLIDLKEPSRGSLGMVQLGTAYDVAARCSGQSLSLALGELREWSECLEFPQLPEELRYLKMGLAGQSGQQTWLQKWCEAKHRFEESSGRGFEWIAVAYADDRLAQSPRPQEIIDAAIEQKCAGVLFDTWSKRDGNLLDHLSLEELGGYQQTIKEAGLLTAWAGSLRLEHLDKLLPLKPDVIAVRGAVCRHNDRESRLEGKLIEEFRSHLLMQTRQTM